MLDKLFGRKKENKSEWTIASEALERKEITVQEFVDRMSAQKLYYSTPFGDGIAGKSQLWGLSVHDSDTKYYPAFLSYKQCGNFLTAIGRRGFVIIEGTLEDLLDSLDSVEILTQFGAVINPDSAAAVGIEPGIRVSKK